MSCVPSNVVSSTPGPSVGSIARVRPSLKFGACAMAALWPTRADELKHRCTFPRGLGSAAEAHCPARLVREGLFLLNATPVCVSSAGRDK